MIFISPDKTKQFLEDRKKNAIKPEFLKQCLQYNQIMKKSKFANMTKEDIKEMNEVKKANLWKVAEKNTKRNSDGLTVISKDDPWREESEWDEITVHPKVKDGKLLFDRNNKDHRYIVDEEY